MSYSAGAQLAQDIDFINRVASCASVEIAKEQSPLVWSHEHIWWIAASPGFATAYQYALDTSVERPGNDPGVITDAQILGAVQALEAELQAMSEPEAIPQEFEEVPPA